MFEDSNTLIVLRHWYTLRKNGSKISNFGSWWSVAVFVIIFSFWGLIDWINLWYSRSWSFFFLMISLQPCSYTQHMIKVKSCNVLIKWQRSYPNRCSSWVDVAKFGTKIIQNILRTVNHFFYVKYCRACIKCVCVNCLGHIFGDVISLEYYKCGCSTKQPFPLLQAVSLSSMEYGHKMAAPVTAFSVSFIFYISIKQLGYLRWLNDERYGGTIWWRYDGMVLCKHIVLG